MAGPVQTTEPGGRRESDLALPEGVEVGLIGALAVVAVYVAHDLTTGDWLYTPTVLGTLLYAGPDAASMVVADPSAAEPGVAALYSFVHFGAWMIAGFIASALVKLAARRPEMRFLPLLSFATLIAFFFALDAQVAAFHRRPITFAARYLLVDGLWVSVRRSSGKAQRRVVLAVYGIDPQGRRELLDYRQAASESAAEWGRLLRSLIERGLDPDAVRLVTGNVIRLR